MHPPFIVIKVLFFLRKNYKKQIYKSDHN